MGVKREFLTNPVVGVYLKFGVISVTCTGRGEIQVYMYLMKSYSLKRVYMLKQLIL